MFNGGFEDWYERVPNLEALAKKAFILSDTEQSVFEVADGVEESLAVAAHALTKPKQRPDAKSIVRIEIADLQHLGIQVDHADLGDTGIPKWDVRHRNLLAGRNEILRLVEFLVDRCRRGFDRLRRIYAIVVNESLRTICDFSASHCPEHVKLIANWCQSKDKGHLPITLDQIKSEVAIVEFDEIGRAHV